MQQPAFGRAMPCLLATLLLATAGAAVPLDPAHPMSLVGTLPGGGPKAEGAIVEDGDGNLYVTPNGSSSVYRKTPSGSFAQFVTMPGAKVLGLTISGAVLYVGAENGTIFKIDLMQPATAAPALTLPDSATSLAAFVGGALVAGTPTGAFDVDPTAGTSSPVPGLPGAYPGLDVNPTTGSILIADHDGQGILELTAGGAVMTFASGLAGRPVAVAVHPVTGDAYVVLGGSSELVRVARGGVVSPIARGLAGVGNQSGLAFSRDGTKLYLMEKAAGGTLSVSVFTGFPIATAAVFDIPTPGSRVGGHVPISLELWDADTDPLDCTLAFSTDSGATFLPCSTAPTSLLANPTGPLATPGLATYIWNSLDDGVGLVGSQATDVRVTASDGTRVASTTVSVAVVNGVCSIPLLTVPGYTARGLGTIYIGTSDVRGGIAEDLVGNIYAMRSNPDPVEVQRMQPGGSFTAFVTIPGSYGTGLAVRGDDLYIATSNGELHVVDLTAPTPTPVLLTILPAAGNQISPSRLSSKLLVGTASDGVYEVVLPIGSPTQLFDGGQPRKAAAYSGDESAALSTSFASGVTYVHVLGSVSTAAIGPAFAAAPDALAVHPVTGEIFVALSGSACGQDTIERLDPTGSSHITFATGLEFGDTDDSSPLAFSRDGRRLYVVTGIGSASGAGGPRAEVYVIEGFPSIVTCALGGLTPGVTAGGSVELMINADQSDGLPVEVRVEYSTDGGASFDTCTTADCSPLPNPTTLATPVIAASYIWDSLNDLGFLAPVPTQIRLTTGDGVVQTVDMLSAVIDNTTHVEIQSPLCAALESGLITVSFDADDLEGDALVATLEFSTDGGATYQLCSTDVSSPVSNPTTPLPTPVLAGSYIWDSINDLGLTPGVVPVELRVTVDDGADTALALIGVDVDNAWPSLCGVTAPGGSSSGNIDISLEILSATPVTLQVQTMVSVDDGITWSPATAAAGSQVSSPASGVPLGTSVFTWNSQADGIGLSSIDDQVRIRFEVTEPGGYICTCVSPRMEVDNTRFALCPGVCGDCDGNGANQIVDSLLMAQMASGLAATPDRGAPQFHRCNVAGEVYPLSGEITVLDSLVNARFLVGISTLGCCLP